MGKAILSLRPFQGARYPLLRAALQFIFYTHVIFPHQVVGFRPFRVHQHRSPLQIIDETFFVQVRQLLDEELVKALGRFGFALLFQQKEILPQLNVRGLIGAELPDHHDAGEHQDCEKTKQELVSPQELHGFFLTPSIAGSQLIWRLPKFPRKKLGRTPISLSPICRSPIDIFCRK